MQHKGTVLGWCDTDRIADSNFKMITLFAIGQPINDARLKPSSSQISFRTAQITNESSAFGEVYSMGILMF